MRHTKEVARWGIFEWIVTLLLTTCAALLAACAVLAWVYLPAVSAESNSSVVAKNEMETSAILSFKEQQVLSNLKLDAIRNELHALNEKAASASGVIPPRSDGSR
jgi:hypothetical protein